MTHASITFSQTSYSRIIKPLFHITVFPLEIALNFHTWSKRDYHSAHTNCVSQPLCTSKCLITTFWIEMHWHKFNQNSRSVGTAEKSCEALPSRCFVARLWLSRYPKVLCGRASHVHSGAADKIPTILNVLFVVFLIPPPSKTTGAVLNLSQDRYSSESIQLIIHPLILTQNLWKASPKWHAEGFLDTRRWLLSNFFIYFFSPVSISILWRICMGMCRDC